MSRYRMRVKLVALMIAGACAVGLLVWVFTDNGRLAGMIGCVVLLTDLMFVPKLLPHIFRDKDDGRDEE